MWKMHEIREIVKLFDESSLQEMEVELEESENKISLKKQKGTTLSHEYENTEIYKPATVPLAVKEAPVLTNKEIPKKPVSAGNKIVQEVIKNPEDADDATTHKIVSPMVGTFYRAPAEDAVPFVKIGDRVEKSTVVCILEAMKLFNEIEAEVNGKVIDILVQDGQLVEYNQPLILVKTE